VTPLALLRRGARGRSDVRLHHVADASLLADFASSMLTPFRVESASIVLPSDSQPDEQLSDRSAVLFDGIVELGGLSRRVRCASRGDEPAAYELEIGLDPAPAFADSQPPSTLAGAGNRTLSALVDASGTSVFYDFPGRLPRELAELLVGAPLLLALACRHRFCLHASAVRLTQGVVAFLGGSGAGKSTLARQLAARGVPRIADDLLLIAAGEHAGASPRVLPRFPQPRLAREEQPATEATEAPLAAVYLLGGPADTVERSRVRASDATLAIARHTVAARLFAPPLLERHLAFSSSLAATTPVRHLRYPWRPRGIEAVADAILEDLHAPTVTEP
jgi:hypothetical protein